MSDTFNPVTSSKTKLFMQDDQSRIYEHKCKGIAGKFIVSDNTGQNWTACEDLRSALQTTPGDAAWEQGSSSGH